MKIAVVKIAPMRIAGILAACCVAGVIATIGWAAFQTAATPGPARPLAPYVPAGPLLYLEAKDFSGMVKQWNASPEKRAWLASDNHAEFSRSHLLLRLAEAQKEFAAAAGISPNMPFLEQVAGRESALALYDIGKLEFLYITHMPMSSVAASALWQARGKYETRSVAGTAYFVHTTAKGATVAFAATGDYLVLATREDLVAGALALIAGQQQRKLIEEPWYDRSVKSAREAGDLRMVLNLEKIIATPYFRSYWVQRNVSELKQYSTCISDLRVSRPEFTEERILLRKEAPAPHERSNLAEVLRLVPGDAGFYRAWSDPDPAIAASMVEQLLTPSPDHGPASDYAPPAPSEQANVGSQTDLERRVDLPAEVQSVPQTAGQPSALRSVLISARLSALLQIEGAYSLSDTVFTRHRKVLVLSSPDGWNMDAIRGAVQRELAPRWTTSQLGLQWVAEGAPNIFRFDGLAPLALAITGHHLIIGNDMQAVAAVAARANAPAPKVEATYAAGFFHARERQSYFQATAVLDRSRGAESSRPGAVTGEEKQTPAFFSGNVGSLSKSLVRVRSETLISNDVGTQVNQTVRYRWED